MWTACAEKALSLFPTGSVFLYGLPYILTDFLHELLRVAFAVADFLQLQFPLGSHFYLADRAGHQLNKDSKVSDHHAIIVTNRIQQYQPARLTGRENNVLKLIV